LKGLAMEINSFDYPTGARMFSVPLIQQFANQ